MLLALQSRTACVDAFGMNPGSRHERVSPPALVHVRRATHDVHVHNRSSRLVLCMMHFGEQSSSLTPLLQQTMLASRTRTAPPSLPATQRSSLAPYLRCTSSFYSRGTASRDARSEVQVKSHMMSLRIRISWPDSPKARYEVVFVPPSIWRILHVVRHERRRSRGASRAGPSPKHGSRARRGNQEGSRLHRH